MADNRLNGTAYSIARLMHGYFSRKKMHYAIIDQAWMMNSLKEWYGVKISRSVLSYNLKLLRKKGLIRSVKRHKRGVNGSFVPRPSLYFLCDPLVRFFEGVARSMVAQIPGKIKALYEKLHGKSQKEVKESKTWTGVESISDIVGRCLSPG